jgi:hypothetical protein
LKAGEVGPPDYGCVDPDPNSIVTGYSLPAGYYRENIGNLTGLADQITWGDASADLGWYIGVLATEYRLLLNQGENTSDTELELYYALKAYERLDFHAEKNQWPYAGNCAVNGFFGRDDVSQEFVETFFPNFADPLFPNKTFVSDYEDHKSPKNSGPKGAAHMSQDQAINLMMGFALVVKCVDPNANYNGYNFKSNAQYYSDLMMSYMANNFYTIPIPNTAQYADWSGIGIRNGIVLDAYGLAKAGQVIQNENWGGQVFSSGQYENIVSALALSFWEEIPTVPGIAILAPFAGSKKGLIENMAAVGHSWRYGLIPYKVDLGCVDFPYPCGVTIEDWELVIVMCDAEICASAWCYDIPELPFASIGIPEIPLVCVPFKLPTIAVNITGPSLSFMGTLYGNQFYPLLHQYLHNGLNPFISRSFYEDAINSAPCPGPFYYGTLDGRGTTGSGVKGWRASNRWTDPDEGKNGSPTTWGDPSGKAGDYPGLDYMLLYNLYQLVNGPAVPYTNQLHGRLKAATGPVYIFVNGRFQWVTKSNIGTKTNPSTVTAFEDFIVWGDILPGQGLIVRAPDFIDNAGLTFDAQGFFDTEKTPFVCKADWSGYMRVAASDSVDASSASGSVPDSAALMKQYQDYINAELQKEVNKALPDIKKKTQESSYEPVDAYVKRMDIAKKDQAQIFPNPTSGMASIELKLYNDGDVEVSIIDMYGRELLKPYSGKNISAGIYTISFDASSLAEGAYIFSIKTGTTVLNSNFIKK